MAASVVIPVVVIVSRSATEALVAGLAAGFLLHLAVKRDFTALRTPWFILACGYWAWLVLVTALAGSQPAQMLAALAWGRFPLATLAIASWALSSARGQRLAFGVLAGAVGFVALEVWLQFTLGRGLTGAGDAHVDIAAKGRIPQMHRGQPLFRNGLCRSREPFGGGFHNHLSAHCFCHLCRTG